MPRPGVSLLEVIRLVEEHLAASDAADQMADDYLARASSPAQDGHVAQEHSSRPDP